MRPRSGIYQLCLGIFCSLAAILLFYDTLFGQRILLNIGQHFLTAVEPVILGAVFAYLLAPLVNFFDRKCFASIARTKVSRLVRPLSLLATWGLIGIAVCLLASVLLPDLYQSVLQLFGNLDSYKTTITGWITHFLESNPELEAFVSEKLSGWYNDIIQWLKTDFFGRVQSIINAVTGGFSSVVNLVKNLFVGITVSIYMLASKERITAFGRKMTCAFLKERHTQLVLAAIHKADEIFSGFFRGKILDSLIVGVICFIGCSFLDMPYTPLVSVIVGVTNIIPFFGPFLGAIPSTILILLASPIKAVYFVIFVVALQQVDGIIIGPKILCGTTGLSGLWVIAAILVGGTFFGVLGMFLGVPVCACFCCAVEFLMDTLLKKKDMPVEIEAYASQNGEDKKGHP